MTSPVSLTGTRAMFSIATLSHGRVPLAVCLSVLLLGFTAPELSAQAAGLAPADPAAFDSLAVGKQIVTTGVDAKIIFLSPGRLREMILDNTSEGDYQYENTGVNTGTLTYTYDATGNNPDVAKAVVEFTFASPTAGTLVYTHTVLGTLSSLPFEFIATPPEPVPAIPPLALLLLAFMLIASGAWLQRRRRAVASF